MDHNEMMNMDLASIYGTPGGPSQEDLDKTAQAQLFAKLAADNNIDLNQLTDDQVVSLYNQTFSKVAEEDGEKCEDCGKVDCECKKAAPAAPAEDSKEAAARAEFEIQKEAQVKLAEADYLGRVMAHSFTQELGRIGDSMGKEASAEESVAYLNLGEEASALDSKAAEMALAKVAEANWDVSEAQRRIEAIFTLGVHPSEKIASAASVEQGTEIRALELLEQAGYEVNWQ
jgi:hypothetical protein